MHGKPFSPRARYEMNLHRIVVRHEIRNGSMKFGLRDTDIEKILNGISLFPEIKQVVIFGSRAKGTFARGSDVDLAVKGEKISGNTIDRLSSLLNEELPLPYFFDVVCYENIDNRNLKDHIDRVGKEFISS